MSFFSRLLQRRHSDPVAAPPNSPGATSPVLLSPRTSAAVGLVAPAAAGGASPLAALSRRDFEDVAALGEGSFGKVILARRRGVAAGSPDEFAALKVVDKQALLVARRTRDAFTERDVLTRLKHPNILKLHGVFQTDTKLFFALEYMPGGDLEIYLQTQPEQAMPLHDVRGVAQQVFAGLRYLHANGVIFRDLKPANVLLAGPAAAGGAQRCVLADFGLAKDCGGRGGLSELSGHSVVGSPHYVAPEVLHGGGYTEAVDWWSFGVLLYRLLFGRVPFRGRTMKETVDAIAVGDVTFPRLVLGHDAARDLIRRLLTKDPHRRITAAEVAAHAFWHDAPTPTSG